MSVIIRLQNLPMSANASNIRRFFAGLSIPEGGVHIVGGTDGDAFIAFATDEDARKAMLLDRQAINGAPVRLFLSSKTEMQSIIDSARNSALFGAPTTSVSIIPQKSETMQALDVTAPTLPSSFPSYRNGVSRESDRSVDSYPFNLNRQATPPSNDTLHQSQQRFELQRADSSDNMRPRMSERQSLQEPVHNHDYERLSHFIPNDGPANRIPPTGDHRFPQRGFDDAGVPPHIYRSQHNDPSRDRAPIESHYPLATDAAREDARLSHEARFSRPPGEYDRSRFRGPQERFGRHDQREFPEPSRSIPHEKPPGNYYERDPTFPGPTHERDFSVRPPWLNEDTQHSGLKRQYPVTPENDDSLKKRRMPLPAEGAPLGETEWIVRVTLPYPDAGIKSVFDILRGVQIVTKWGIRIEEDALQRPTGYAFVMTTGRESFERALACNGRLFKGKAVKILQSNLEEFYSVTDSTFHLKCPPEISKKLPSPEQRISPPHHADGCLEVAELPPDTTKSEIVRFLGAPGLTASDVSIAGFASTDKSASKTPGSVRALVSLPSSKDITILLSAKPRPLRPDGAFPPVRLTPISRLQLRTYAGLSLNDKSKPDSSVSPVQNSGTITSKTTDPLTCAFISGLERPATTSEILRLFPSVLVPGDAVRVVGPANTSAYVDFISENNCRRAVADVNGNDAKVKQSHPRFRIEPISRSEMEDRLSSTNSDNPTLPSETKSLRPGRDRDPRELSRPTWESRPMPPRGPRHPSSGSPFPLTQKQTPNRSKFDEPVFEQLPFNNQPRRPEPFTEAAFRPQQSIDAIPPTLPPSDFMHPASRLPDPGSLPPRHPVPEFTTVHIGNLPPNATVEQLAGILRDYYFVPGSIRLRRDIHGMPTGEGLVDFNSTYDGDRVIRDLNGYRLAGRPLVLCYDRRP